ncbi:hypothetical protein OG535_24935 [Kitasatospora sp. NBC_00085]|uniref:hypothetical protein n=1 Tax=unclassified Kitasatospora TaxID=2633591 RepID=UPI0032475059
MTVPAGLGAAHQEVPARLARGIRLLRHCLAHGWEKRNRSGGAPRRLLARGGMAAGQFFSGDTHHVLVHVGFTG